MYMCVDRDNYLELLKRRYMSIGISANYVTRKSRQYKEQLKKDMRACMVAHDTNTCTFSRSRGIEHVLVHLL